MTESFPTWKRALRWLLVVLALGFIVLSGLEIVEQWETGELRVGWGWLIASLLPMLIAGGLQAYAWWVLVTFWKGASPPAKPAFAIYFESQVARYIPGKVGLPLVRIAGAEDMQLDPRHVGASIVVEMLSWSAVGAGVGLTLLTLDTGQGSRVLDLLGESAPWLLAAIGFTLLGLCTLPLRFFPHALRSLLQIQEQDAALLPWRVPLIHVAHWLMWAMHGWLVLQGLGLSACTALYLAGLFPLAPVVGFLVLAAPGGLGVREALIAGGLAAVLGSQAALAAALACRVASLGTDLVLWVSTRRY